jgi:hypothetical protein
MPTEKLENGSWPHPSRLPLGRGWKGNCTAPGHDGETPTAEELHDFCNLGYAQQCPRLPPERIWDSVRFGLCGAMAAENAGSHRIQVRYVCERGHLPADSGFLEFDPSRACWTKRHPDARVQRMAECFVEAHRERKYGREAEAAAS